MKSLMSKVSVALAVAMIALMGLQAPNTYADNDGPTTAENAATSISISPVSKILQLSANTTYEDKFTVTNNSSSNMPFEVYASPYSYSYSEAEDSYKLGFSHENNYTQITRWIKFKDPNGNYVERATYTAEPGGAVEVNYKISTPESIPAGGQYAVLFAHTLSSSVSNGIKTEASPGLVVYGRAEGDTILTGEISKLEISDTAIPDAGGEEKNLIGGTAKVKNTGNVDFTASGKLTVTGIFGIKYYETAATSTRARVSVIPESELSVSDSWDETPYFGLFNVSWTVSAAGGEETTSRMILIMPAPIIILMILLLTIIIVWIIIVIRKRKERRSRFMV